MWRLVSVALVGLFLSLVCLSCGSVPRYVNPDPAGPARFTVRVWVRESPPFSTADDVLAGCNVWREKGVYCRQVSNIDYADVAVYADGRPCVADAEGHTTLALAYRGGRIEMRTRCLMNGDALDRHKYRAVLAHEIGHQLGVWEHVATSCDGCRRRHSSGQLVCGRALMNPYYDSDVYFMTPVDGLAFDVRDPFYSVLFEIDDRPRPPPSETPDCIYRSR